MRTLPALAVAPTNLQTDAPSPDKGFSLHAQAVRVGLHPGLQEVRFSWPRSVLSSREGQCSRQPRVAQCLASAARSDLPLGGSMRSRGVAPVSRRKGVCGAAEWCSGDGAPLLARVDCSHAALECPVLVQWWRGGRTSAWNHHIHCCPACYAVVAGINCQRPKAFIAPHGLENIGFNPEATLGAQGQCAAGPLVQPGSTSLAPRPDDTVQKPIQGSALCSRHLADVISAPRGHMGATQTSIAFRSLGAPWQGVAAG